MRPNSKEVNEKKQARQSARKEMALKIKETRRNKKASTEAVAARKAKKDLSKKEVKLGTSGGGGSGKHVSVSFRNEDGLVLPRENRSNDRAAKFGVKKVLRKPLKSIVHDGPVTTSTIIGPATEQQVVAPVVKTYFKKQKDTRPRIGKASNKARAARRAAARAQAQV